MKQFIIITFFISSLTLSFGQTPNYLDPSFGDTGTVAMPFDIVPTGTDWSYLNITYQGDGKILAAGKTNKLSNPAFGMIKFNNNGSVDSSFGIDGRVIKRIGSGSAGATSRVMLQSDGKIVVAGDDYYNFYTFRFLPNGEPDTTFNKSGEISFENNKGFCNGATFQPDGKIILGGTVNNSKKIIVGRIDKNGLIDSSFGQFGKASYSYGVYGCGLNAISVRPSGEILACGSISNGGNVNFLLVQLKSNGELDSAFGINGAVTIDFGTSCIAHDLKLLTNGHVIVAGRSVFGGGMMAKVDEDGNLINSFGNNGLVITSMPNGGIGPEQIEVDGNDNIYLGGHINKGGTDDDFYLLRYTPDGIVDTSFAKHGIETKFGNEVDRVRDMIIQPDGKILLAGYHGGDVTRLGAMARYLPFPVSVNEINKVAQSIYLYPNPTTSKTIVKNLPLEEGDYYLTDISGKRLLFDHKTLTTDQVTIDVAHLPTGIYTFHFLSSNGHLSTNFVKN